MRGLEAIPTSPVDSVGTADTVMYWSEEEIMIAPIVPALTPSHGQVLLDLLLIDKVGIACEGVREG